MHLECTEEEEEEEDGGQSIVQTTVDVSVHMHGSVHFAAATILTSSFRHTTPFSNSAKRANGLFWPQWHNEGNGDDDRLVYACRAAVVWAMFAFVRIV